MRSSSARALRPAPLSLGQSAPAPRPSLAEPSLSPDGRTIVFASGGDIWTAPSARRHGASARLAPGDRVAATLLPRRQAPRLRLEPHGQRRHLRPDARHGRVEAPDLRRLRREARRLVSRRQVDLLLVERPGHLRHERRLPRLVRRRHAHAGHRRPLRQRVFLGPVARRRRPSRSRRGALLRPSGGARARAISTRARSGSSATAGTSA